MRKSYYGITMLEIGPNRDRVVDVLVGWYQEEQRSIVEQILDQIEDDGRGTVIDCLTKDQIDDFVGQLEGVGAKVTVYEMPEDEVQDAINCGDITDDDEDRVIEKRENEKSNPAPQEDDDDEGESMPPMQRYQLTMDQLWKYLLFCMAGWAVGALGFCIAPFNDVIGYLIVVVGVIIVDIPAFKSLRAGYGLASLFAASGAVYEITYSDGRKTTDYSEKNAGFVLAIFTYLITLAIGVVVMVVRVLRTFFQALRLKKKHGLQLSFKDGPLFKPAIAILVFIIGCVAIAISNGVANYQYSHPTDMSKQEITQTMDSAVAKMKASDWSFYERSYDSNQNKYIYAVAVQHAGSDNSYLVEIGELGVEPFGIPVGMYIYNGSEWLKVVDIENRQFEATDQGEKLNMFLIENLVDLAKLKADEKNVFGRQENYDNSYSIYFHRNKKDGGMLQVRISPQMMIKYISGIPGLDYGVEIHDDLNFGGLTR